MTERPRVVQREYHDSVVERLEAENRSLRLRAVDAEARIAEQEIALRAQIELLAGRLEDADERFTRVTDAMRVFFDTAMAELAAYNPAYAETERPQLPAAAEEPKANPKKAGVKQ